MSARSVSEAAVTPQISYWVPGSSHTIATNSQQSACFVSKSADCQKHKKRRVHDPQRDEFYVSLQVCTTTTIPLPTAKRNQRHGEQPVKGMNIKRIAFLDAAPPFPRRTAAVEADSSVPVKQ
jgi:hypothetical protein